MTWIVGAVSILALLVLGGFFFLRWFLNHLAQRAHQDGILAEFESGLAIPMRDADTRRSADRKS